MRIYSAEARINAFELAADVVAEGQRRNQCSNVTSTSAIGAGNFVRCAARRVHNLLGFADRLSPC